MSNRSLEINFMLSFSFTMYYCLILVMLHSYQLIFYLNNVYVDLTFALQKMNIEQFSIRKNYQPEFTYRKKKF